MNVSSSRLVAWFSCGAASAVALKLVAHRNPLAVYCNTLANENTDNLRFMRDVERWTGVPITVISSEKYKTVEEVFDARKYMSGIGGAPCTVELKKVPRFAFQRPDDVHVFGMTLDEHKRIKDFEDNNHELLLEWPLVDELLDKKDCFRILQEASIALPLAYKHFDNNNCEGCVKATSPAYWNLVRKHSPAVFKRRCEQSRRLGCKLVRLKGTRIFLDELPPDEKESFTEDLSCGPQCSFQPLP